MNNHKPLQKNIWKHRIALTACLLAILMGFGGIMPFMPDEIEGAQMFLFYLLVLIFGAYYLGILAERFINDQLK